MIALCKAIVGLPFDLISLILCGEVCDPKHEPNPVPCVTSVVTYQKCRRYYCDTHDISEYEFEKKIDSNEKYRPEYVRSQMATKGICIIGD